MTYTAYYPLAARYNSGNALFVERVCIVDHDNVYIITKPILLFPV